ncbi:hypothetical protein [Mycobacterium sp. DL99]|uniref:hypothetical protein n=1 Tax=Mycobacterium sp. DL99 TaxID=2528957 RepID=UPI001081764B|nr:hypothetical protein [Mycobacterium sp. DL99]
MSELTPERIRDAAATIRIAWPDAPNGSAAGVVLTGLHALEREQAAEAKREKRIQKLAEAMWLIETGLNSVAQVPSVCVRVARGLLDRYPALAEAVEE